jgi:site-specific recombinase XerD
MKTTNSDSWRIYAARRTFSLIAPWSSRAGIGGFSLLFTSFHFFSPLFICFHDLKYLSTLTYTKTINNSPSHGFFSNCFSRADFNSIRTLPPIAISIRPNIPLGFQDAVCNFQSVLDGQTPSQSAAPKLDPHAQAFLTHLAADRSASPYTQRNYRQALEEFTRWHRAERSSVPCWTTLQRDDFRAYLRFLGREQLARAAVRLRFSALRSFYKFLVRRGIVSATPIKNIQLPKLERRLPRFLTADQMNALLNAPILEFAEQSKAAKAKAEEIDRTIFFRDTAILETIYSCGLRISELCGLRMEDLDTSERLIRVRGKGKKERVTPIGDHAIQAINHYWKTLGKIPARNEPVFWTTAINPDPSCRASSNRASNVTCRGRALIPS